MKQNIKLDLRRFQSRNMSESPAPPSAHRSKVEDEGKNSRQGARARSRTWEPRNPTSFQENTVLIGGA